MSSGYVGGPSRGAWEGANFWQRMNPAAMTSAPAPTYNDALEQAFATHRQCAGCSKLIKPRGYERHLRACSVRHWRNRNVPF